MRQISVGCCVLLMIPGVLFAQAKDDAQERLKALEERVLALEAEIKALRASQTVGSTNPQTGPAVSSAPAVEVTPQQGAPAPAPPQTATEVQVPSGTPGAQQGLFRSTGVPLRLQRL